jgi:predicted transcriptional regulator
MSSNECAKMSCLLTYKNNKIDIDINTRVLIGIEYDLIIGLQTIRRYKLTKIFHELFNEEGNNNKTLQLNNIKEYLHSLVNEGFMQSCINADDTSSVDEIMTALEQRSQRSHADIETLNSIVDKAALLDIEDDDDFVDEYLEAEDAALEQMVQTPKTASVEKDNPISLVTIAGSPQLQQRITEDVLCRYVECLSAVLKSTPAKIK